jgi:glycosyltransferase involved in cell wall biosynthesis
VKVRLFHTLPADHRVSSEVYAGELTSALHRIAGGDLKVTHCTPPGVVHRAIPGPAFAARFAGYVDHYAGYPWHARRDAADVLHIVEHGYAHLALRLPAKRTVVTFHDAMLMKLKAHELPVAAYPRMSILANRLNLAGIARVARVIAVSEDSRKDLLRFTNCDPARVVVVPEGVGPQFRPCGPAHVRPAGAPLRILHVGHCGFYKNVEAVLRALPLIAGRLGRPVELVKVGGGFTSEQRALISRLRIGDRVRHVGMVPAAELPGVYRSADVLLMPSLHEGFGLPVLEAMACGTPVVASDAGSLPEVVGEAGLLVHPTDIDGLADASVRVLSDPALRDELRRRGIERAGAFTWDRAAAATLNVYSSVYEENR